MILVLRAALGLILLANPGLSTRLALAGPKPLRSVEGGSSVGKLCRTTLIGLLMVVRPGFCQEADEHRMNGSDEGETSIARLAKATAGAEAAAEWSSCAAWLSDLPVGNFETDGKALDSGAVILVRLPDPKFGEAFHEVWKDREELNELLPDLKTVVKNPAAVKDVHGRVMNLVPPVIKKLICAKKIWGVPVTRPSSRCLYPFAFGLSSSWRFQLRLFEQMNPEISDMLPPANTDDAATNEHREKELLAHLLWAEKQNPGPPPLPGQKTSSKLDPDGDLRQKVSIFVDHSNKIEDAGGAHEDGGGHDSGTDRPAKARPEGLNPVFHLHSSHPDDVMPPNHALVGCAIEGTSSSSVYAVEEHDVHRERCYLKAQEMDNLHQCYVISGWEKEGGREIFWHRSPTSAELDANGVDLRVFAVAFVPKMAAATLPDEMRRRASVHYEIEVKGRNPDEVWYEYYYPLKKIATIADDQLQQTD